MTLHNLGTKMIQNSGRSRGGAQGTPPPPLISRSGSGTARRFCNSSIITLWYINMPLRSGFSIRASSWRNSPAVATYHILYRYWWNTRIFPFTKKSYLQRVWWRYYFYLSCVRILVSPWLLTWFFSSSLEFWLFGRENISISVFISPL